jgi:hypothetical protein
LILAAALLPPGTPASVVVVDTKDDKPAPGKAAVPKGVPSDFEFYAQRTYFDPSPEKSVKRALKELENISTNETIAPGNAGILIRRPCLYAGVDGIDADEHVPEIWLADLDGRQDVLKRAVRSVGRIEVYDLDDLPEERRLSKIAVGFIAGTGFVAAPGVLMTNRHVAELFTDFDAADPLSFKKDQQTLQPATVFVNFAGIYGQESKLCRVEKVLYVGPKKGPDVALLKFRPDGDGGPAPLRLQTADPAVDVRNRVAVVCGYPSSGNSDDDTKRADKFMRMLRVKRLSLGRLSGKQMFNNRVRLFHDCTTLGGSSGSPLIDLASGTVWGLHFSGWNEGMEGNKAEPVWDVYATDGVKQVLGPVPDSPPVSAKPSAVADAQASRPVLPAKPGNPRQLTDTWLKNGADQYVAKAIPSVGLITGPDGKNPLATAFMVGDGVAMTITYQSLAGGEKMVARGSLDERQLAGEKLVVSFDPEPAANGAKRFAVKKVLYRNPSTYVTLLAIEGSADLPPPLALESETPGDGMVGQSVFATGYVFEDSRIPPEVFNAVFPPPYGDKRVSLGKIIAPALPTSLTGNAPPVGERATPAQMAIPAVGRTGDLFHDCSTAGGSAGAPVISLTTGKVVGVHYAGSYRVTNAAVPSWKILQSQEVQRLLKAK